MTTREEYVANVLDNEHRRPAIKQSAQAFMPSNVALIKYWGKRDAELNLPLVSSISYTLHENYGSNTRVTLSSEDRMELDGMALSPKDPAFQSAMRFLDLFRAKGEFFDITTLNTIPTAAGLASSASGFAALTECMVLMKGWTLSPRSKSMLARLGSGSAARSFFSGIVMMDKGTQKDGMDCYAGTCKPQARMRTRMAVLLVDRERKAMSSREAMRISMETSSLADEWPAVHKKHLAQALAALKDADFHALGYVVEENALFLHELLRKSKPSIVYDKPETVALRNNIVKWREKDGLPVYFTQDAGPNLKMIFPMTLKKDIENLLKEQNLDYFIA